MEKEQLNYRYNQINFYLEALKESEKNNIEKKKLTRTMREKLDQLQIMLIMGSHCARNTMGINND